MLDLVVEPSVLGQFLPVPLVLDSKPGVLVLDLVLHVAVVFHQLEDLEHMLLQLFQ
jgi:hypothetical protein